MIKYAYIEHDELEENESNALYDRVEAGSDKILYTAMDEEYECICFPEENIAEIENKLQTEFLCIYPLKDFVSGCDGGESRDICGMTITMQECITELRKNILDFEMRIFKSDSPQDEVYKILNEILVKIVEERLEEIKEEIEIVKGEIASGEFKWE